MNSVVFTKSEIEAAMLISRNEILSNHCIDIHEYADKVILLAEKIKAERAVIAMEKM